MHYKNPVYPDYFADPFVWEHGGEYFAIGTGANEASGNLGRGPGRAFPLLHSRDLIRWSPAGKALERPDPALGATFWAPEVAFSEGRFWLYYSVGHGDTRHQIRVAAATAPLGPYRDVQEQPLVAPKDPPFAIDPHPFRDEDGRWVLFYARDFLDSGYDEPSGQVRAGTALAVDRLSSMDRIAGEERIVLRARCDWQRFMANRPIYGSTFDWHTLEGPFVRKHEGRYYCFYSGGRWETETYGVDYAVADQLLGPYSDKGNEEGPRILRTAPGRVIGPGHNSIVAGPDGSDYIIYHAWDAAMTARQLCIDPLQWTPQGPRCAGPS
jgi:beta-xylosidase